MTNRTKGALCLILSSTSMAFMSVFVKLTGGLIPLMEQIFARNLVMLIFAICLIKRTGHNFIPHKENRVLVFLRSFFGFLALVGTFYATNNLYLGDAQALQKLSPIFVTIFAILFLGENLTRLKLISLLTAFVGALFIVKPEFSADIYPGLIAILAAVLSAIAYNLLSFIQRKDRPESGDTIIFNFALVCCILSFPLMARDFVAPRPSMAVLLLLIGVFAALGQYLMTKAYSLTEASNISIFDYTGLVISSVLGLVIFGEVLPISSIIGIVIIILSAYISFKYGRDPR